MSHFTPLYENLQHQLEHYQALLELELKKIDAMTVSDGQEIAQLTQQEAQLLSLLSSLEGERLGLVGALGFSGLTMSQTLEYITDREEKDRLQSVFSPLCEALTRLREVNTMAQGMAALRLHDLEVLTKTLAPPPAPILYKSDGTVAKEEKKTPPHTFRQERI